LGGVVGVNDDLLPCVAGSEANFAREA
jgi:hypothetical protein